jgi:hypothetical protein
MTQTVGFGFNPDMGAHHFVVTLCCHVGGDVTVAERFVYGNGVEGRAIYDPPDKVMVSGARWQAIAEPVRKEFCRRVPGRCRAWKPGENLVAPRLGMELVLLLWAIEEATSSDIPTAVANWLGLAPEERWWLYAAVNGASVRATKDYNRGWRKAIKVAFAENPVGHNRGNAETAL